MAVALMATCAAATPNIDGYSKLMLVQYVTKFMPLIATMKNVKLHVWCRNSNSEVSIRR